MSAYKIFMIEDDPWYGEILQYHLSLNPDYQITRFSSGTDFLHELYKQPDLITLDFSLPDMNGEKLYKKIRETDSQVPVIIISSQEDIAVAVNLLKMGVTDYIIKDSSTKELLWNSIVRLRENQALKTEVEVLKEELGVKYSFDKSLIGQSPALQQVFHKMEKAVRTNINVSITGETGTGKELVAKAIHFNSEFERKAFVPVNMAAIPHELVESELFGHEKGAFTGAVNRKIGKFEEANGGTIFLDEIAELDINVQSKLLRVLQEREIVRIGGNQRVKLNIRVITATHKNLSEEVKKGKFREDLYYRIMGLPIELPPLRNRDADIILLSKHFANEFARNNRLGNIQISKEAKSKLLHYTYPGNIRELKAVIELAVVFCDSHEIKASDITFNDLKGEEHRYSEHKTLRHYICDLIQHHLKNNNNDVILTARKLDIGKSTIYQMLKNGEIKLNK